METKYALVIENDASKFVDIVNEKLREGWSLYGDVSHLVDNEKLFFMRELVFYVESRPVKNEKSIYKCCSNCGMHFGVTGSLCQPMVDGVVLNDSACGDWVSSEKEVQKYECNKAAHANLKCIKCGCKTRRYSHAISSLSCPNCGAVGQLVIVNKG